MQNDDIRPQNDSAPTPLDLAPAPATRSTLRRERTHRRRLLAAAAAVAALGVIAGTGFTVKASIDTRASVAATELLSQNGALDHDQREAYAAIAAARTYKSAEDAISAANSTLAAVDGKVDASALQSSVASLGGFKQLPLDQVTDLAEQTRAEAVKAAAAAAAYDDQQAAAAAAAEQARQEALAQANTPDGARAAAADLSASQFGWGADQFSCLNSLWSKESGWRYDAYNASSGATGIPQALPGSKMASAGADWQSNARTQIAWGLDYIQRAYGTPCAAWSHSQAVNWY